MSSYDREQDEKHEAKAQASEDLIWPYVMIFCLGVFGFGLLFDLEAVNFSLKKYNSIYTSQIGAHLGGFDEKGNPE